MSQGLGFRPVTPEWEGPVSFTLALHSEKGLVVRYLCHLADHQLDYYAPRAMLSELPGHKPLQAIKITLGRSQRPTQGIGFRPSPIAPLSCGQCWEYDFLEKKANSVRYAVRSEGQSYSIYVPYEVFKGFAFPERLFVYVDLPDQQADTGCK